jgi:hypothetical protein
VLSTVDLSHLSFTGQAQGDILYRGASAWALLPVGSEGQFLSLASGLPTWADVGGGETILSKALNSNIAINSTSPVQIFSETLTGVAVGDTIEVDIWYTIFNDSGANRTHTHDLIVGDMNLQASFVKQNSSTSESGYHLAGVCTITATNLARLMAMFLIAANLNVGVTGTGTSTGGWDSTTSDLTGSLAISLEVSSSSTAATQTLRLHGYTIRKRAST